MELKELIKLALEARKMSYSPYSGFMVGAALLGRNGKVYQGCNIENSAFTPTNCAERTAFFKAVSEGVKEFEMIVIVGGAKDAKELEFCAPCGVCRQVMMEFCDYDSFKIVLAKNPDEYKIYTLKEMLPEGFGPSNLK
ncbi:MAG: cytidine deaminase [Anaerovoracaceae bacterium]